MRSLVETCAQKREDAWRQMDAVMERLGEAVGVGPLRRYRSNGGRPPTPEWKLERIRELLRAGLGAKQIARELAVGKEAVYRVRNSLGREEK